MIDVILIVAACVCFAVDAFNLVQTKVNLTALGLLLWALAGLL